MAGGRAKAFVFTRVERAGTAYALVWAVKGEVRLELPRGAVAAMRPFGADYPVARAGEASTVTVGGRTYLVLRQTSVAEAKQLLQQARVL